MDTRIGEESEISSPAQLRQAAQNFVSALTATPQFQAFAAAGEKLDQDPAAQAVIEAFQAKQQELRMRQNLKAISAQDREEFERLRRAMQSQPTVAAFLQAQAGLISICRAAGDVLTERTGMNFGSSACSSGCCG